MSAFKVGDKVGPAYDEDITGIVIGVNPDGTFTVRWNDGSIEKGCQPSLAVKIK